MKSQLLAATAVALFAFAPASAQAPKPAKPTPAEAKAFVDKAEAELAAFNQYVAKSAWVRATYITEDTQWLEAKATAEQNELTARYAREAAKFDGVAVDPVTARKLKLLKLFLVSPAPNRPGAAGELATIATRLDSTYSAGKFQHGGKTLTLNDAEDVLARSRDPAELKAVWEGWHSVAPQMRSDYAKLAELSNEGARGLGFKDTGALWRSNYDMDPDAYEFARTG